MDLPQQEAILSQIKFLKFECLVAYPRPNTTTILTAEMTIKSLFLRACTLLPLLAATADAQKNGSMSIGLVSRLPEHLLKSASLKLTANAGVRLCMTNTRALMSGGRWSWSRR